MIRRSLLAAFLAAMVSATEAADSLKLPFQPFVLAGGQTNRFSALDDPPQALWLRSATLPDGIRLPIEPAGSNQFSVAVPEHPAGTWAALRILTKQGYSGIRPVLLDHAPVLPASATNHAPGAAQRIATPAGVEGFAFEKQQSYFRFSARKGEPVLMEVVAHRLCSQLDPILRVLDEQGRELAFNEDDPFCGRDSRLRFVPPRTGEYLVAVHDVAHGGGPGFFFQLRLGLPWLAAGPPPAALRAESKSNPATALAIPSKRQARFEVPAHRDRYRIEPSPGQRLVFKTETRRLGWPCDARLALLDAKGAEIAVAVGEGPAGASLTNTFEKGGLHLLEVRELSRLFGEGFGYELSVAEFKPGFTLSCDKEALRLDKDGSATLKLKAIRHGYDGPIQIQIAAASAVEIENGLIPEKKNEAEIKLKLPPGTLPQIFQLHGLAESQGETLQARVSTMPALRELYPLQMFPLKEMDGWIAVNPASP